MTNKNLEFLRALEAGEIRVAQKQGQTWIVNTEVKQQILQIFKDSQVVDMGSSAQPQYYGYPDKELLKARSFTIQDKVRMVPGGSSVRAGAYIGHNVIIMPPAYVNIGAYVDDNTMVDSHVLVGSCAQIGKRVHLSAAVQVGGVLEPIGNRPVIIEDDCFIGAGVILTEGILVRKGAVIAPGVVLSAAVPIYDLVNQQIYKNEIPENAVVVPGSRPVGAIGNNINSNTSDSASNAQVNSWAKELGLSLNCAIIVKYRDQKTAGSVSLEALLR